MKCISFKPEFIPLIKNGTKTVTRRIKFKGLMGERYYFKAGRTGTKEGYLQIEHVMTERLHEMEYTEIEFIKEGIPEPAKFKALWNKLNKPGFKWEDNPLVYRIVFKYLGEEL